jgi:hypothetical protein
VRGEKWGDSQGFPKKKNKNKNKKNLSYSRVLTDFKSSGPSSGVCIQHE